MKQIPVILLLAFISFNCEQNAPDPVPLLPTVSTVLTTSITANTALSGGNATAGRGPSITARGVCWGTASNPVIAGNHTIDGSGGGIFASQITGLTANSTYYVRAYATNIVGTSYGNEISFTTTTTTTALPTVTSTAITSITAVTASGGGNVTADGGATVTARGVCWSIAANPTIALSTKTTDGTGIGIFTSAITGLTASTTYHVRAYATNSVGTAYGNDISFTTSSSTPTVYVGGYEAGSIDYIARTWKNGVKTTLTGNVDDGQVKSVFISGTDFYAVGYERSGPSVTNVPKIWKNDVPATLPGLCGGTATAVSISGSDVYVAGYTASPSPSCTFSAAKTWKNNVGTDLTNGTKHNEAHAMFVSGSDVYVVGYDLQVSFPVSVAKIWKNGIETALTNGSSGNAYARAVFVSGTDVYVAGEENVIGGVPFAAKIWKNGVGTSYNAGTYSTYFNSIYVSGADVYAVGYEETATALVSVAKIWKNGVATALTNGTRDARANSVFVFGTDVYVAGYENNGTKDVAKIWKNGIATSLTDGTQNAWANSIFVK